MCSVVKQSAVPWVGVLVEPTRLGQERPIAMDYYVQVRYPQAGRWVTIAACDDRAAASGVASEAYRDRRNGSGETPRQVRVVSTAQLRREGGQRDLEIADADVVRYATT